MAVASQNKRYHSCVCLFWLPQGFGCAELLYSDYARLPAALETQLGARYVEMEDLVKCAFFPLWPSIKTYTIQASLVGRLD